MKIRSEMYEIHKKKTSHQITKPAKWMTSL